MTIVRLFILSEWLYEETDIYFHAQKVVKIPSVICNNISTFSSINNLELRHGFIAHAFDPNKSHPIQYPEITQYFIG